MEQKAPENVKIERNIKSKEQTKKGLIMNIIEHIKKERLYMDGGMGSLIQKRIKNPGRVPEELNISHPDVIAEIQSLYVEAGADILLANTFGANGYKAQDSSYSVSELVKAGVAIAKGQNPKYVALDVGPLGSLVGDVGSISFSEAVIYFEEVVRAGADAGVDLVFVETMTDITEARAALIAAKNVCDLPVAVSMTYEATGRTLTGTDPETAVCHLSALGADIIGVNCSVGPAQMLPIVKELVAHSTVPVAVEPNAGLPRVENGQTVYDIGSDDFAAYMKEIAEAGATLLGGCCGTTPEHINKTIALTKDIPLSPLWEKASVPKVASATKTVTLGQDVVIIGEAINPTTNPELKADLRAGRTTVVKRLAIEQKRQGADILDVNVGLPDIDEKAMFLKAVKAISQVVDLPLQLDSTKPDVIGAVLSEYTGVPIINSVSGKDESLDAVLPLAKKYGASVLGLTLDERGLPKTMRDRVEIADKIIKRAAGFGIAKERMLIDCLTLTVSAQQDAVRETLMAIPEIKKRYGVPTVLGVSNIAFGLPNRRLINRTFFAMALAAGLDTPIIKTADQSMMDTVDAYRALAAIDKGCSDYVAKHQNDKPTSETNTGSVSVKNNKEKNLGGIKQMVVEGMKEEIIPAVKALLTTTDPMVIVNEHLIPGLDEVGARFETGEMFLPNLIFSAETVQAAFSEIKSVIGQSSVTKGRVILATVQGDVHDIGKNIVKVVMENYGYDVIDLGKDVPPTVVVDTALKENIQLVGLSALMTTTVEKMEETVRLIKEANSDIVVMVGGAVLNETFAKQIGADYYGKDAKAGADIAKMVFGV